MTHSTLFGTRCASHIVGAALQWILFLMYGDVIVEEIRTEKLRNNGGGIMTMDGKLLHKQ